MKKEDNAFPMVEWGTIPGMSKRFYAACAAMQGLLVAGGTIRNESIAVEELITISYGLSDELLRQEGQE